VAGQVKEGWYEDPADRHQYRWFSQGVPTNLVKDGRNTSRDALSIIDTAAFESMDLEQPPDRSPLLHTDDTASPRFDILKYGEEGPVFVVNTAADAPDPLVWSQPAGLIELIVVLLPILAMFIAPIAGAPLTVVLAMPLLSLLLALAGRWRRRRTLRQLQRDAFQR
jgi:hypothetical protein